MTDASKQATDNLRIQNAPLRPIEVDEDVYDLAAHFLKNSTDATLEDRQDLAERIQDVIDSFMLERFPV